MQTAEIPYYDTDLLCNGFIAYESAQKGPQPTVLIVHAFDGITDHIRNYAKKVAAAGYTAFCVDMFGGGKTATDMDSCMGLIMPFLNDRALLQRRILAGFAACKEQDVVDSAQIMAMGFCFGGMCALDLARAGADIKAVAALHSVLAAPENVRQGDFTAKVLILHGYDDPQVGPDQLPVIAKELNDKQVDWQFVYFSHTKHSYTEPKAADIGSPESGREYNATSAHRAWAYCQLFFEGSKQA